MYWEHGYPQTPVHFKVMYNVVVNNQVVIAADSVALGHLVNTSRAKYLGQPGYVEVQVNRVIAVDGSEIDLISTSLTTQG